MLDLFRKFFISREEGDGESPQTNDNNDGKLKRNIIIACIILVIAIIFSITKFISSINNKSTTHNIFDIQMMRELTTLQCRYHNVTVRDKEGGVFGNGEQYVWFEYDVIVDIGIDFDNVKITPPNKKGIVKIYLPQAEILGATEDESTIYKPVCELGPFTSLTSAEERQIINDGVKKLKEDAINSGLVKQAYHSAKKILEQYVINTGKIIGEDYTVEWIDTPDNAQTESNNQKNTTTE